jgi:hypothetical protein
MSFGSVSQSYTVFYPSLFYGRPDIILSHLLGKPHCKSEYLSFHTLASL